MKALVFSVILYGSKNSTLKDRKIIAIFECCCWRRLLRILWAAKKTDLLIIKQINLELSFEAQMAIRFSTRYKTLTL